MNPRQEKLDFHQAKKEGDEPNHYNNNPFPQNNNITTTSSSRQFSSFKNPRIVRASRTCGGKDRHSKVCTVKGLRDRRIRLSVPTAIQLYDLQDRLGLSQPSKVVDWLMDATKNEIDKLPPLPCFPFHHQESSSLSVPDFPNNQELGIKMNEQNFFPLNNHSNAMPNMPYNSSYLINNWDHHPNLSLSQFGEGYNSFSFSSQTDVFPSAANIVPSYCPPFPSQIMENINDNFQQNSILPTTLHLRSFSLDDQINSRSVDSQDKDKRN